MSIEAGTGERFVLAASTVIAIGEGAEQVTPVAHYLRDFLGTSIGPTQPRVVTAREAAAGNRIVLSLGGAAELGEEGYELTIAADRVSITASRAAGLFYGAQTLRQLLPAWLEYRAARPDKARVASLAPMRVLDRPRFRWRGAMLDVARHFFGVDDVKRYVDLMALHKLNRLHLHLSDDQGWRIEIKSWPNLTRVGGSTEVGGGAGGFFTQEDYAAIVSYARDRFITIVPEIDMPGHTNAALASYAELTCDSQAPALYTGIDVGFSALCVEKDVVYTFISDVVREIGALTPGAYFHIGGDEVKTLPPERYFPFIERVRQIVESHGKQVIGWDEIAGASLSPGSIVQHWRPSESPARAVAKGVSVILSPANRMYLDMKYDRATALGLNWAAYIDVPSAYSWDPAKMFEGVPESSILGVEAPLWSETVDTMRDVEYLVFPRLAAVAEIAWSPASTQEWNAFRVRLGGQGPRWTALGVNFYRAPEVPWR